MTDSPLLAALPNFRDISGYEAADGRRVRRGVIYRSEAPVPETDADRARMGALGIRFVCDLRGTRERALAPAAWPNGMVPETLHLDVGMDLRAGAAELVAIITADPSAAGVRRMMMTSYAQMPQAFAHGIGEFFGALLAAKLPALFHCTAGKDRTGFLGAVLLETLGVPRATIHHDYALTGRYSNSPRMMGNAAIYVRAITGRDDHDADMLEALCGVSPDYIDASFAAIDRGWSSTAAYLQAVAEFGPAEQVRLRDLLLE